MLYDDVRVNRGDVWWVDFGEPAGSEPGYKRPVVVLQSDYFNHTTLNTVIVVVLTGNLDQARLAGNVLLTKRMTGLARDSVANGTQVATVDKGELLDKCGSLDPDALGRVAAGVRQVLDL